LPDRVEQRRRPATLWKSWNAFRYRGCKSDRCTCVVSRARPFRQPDQTAEQRGLLLLATRSSDSQRREFAPCCDRARYLFKDFNRAITTEVCLEPFRVVPDAEFVRVGLKFPLSRRCSFP
jgi:hypothetical protein